MELVSVINPQGGPLTPDQIRAAVARACPAADYRDQRVILIVPDGTRTAPIGSMFQAIHNEVGESTKALDVLIALGTHPPMSERATATPVKIAVTSVCCLRNTRCVLRLS